MSGFSVERDIAMPMRDGVILRGDLWRPDGDKPVPTILIRTPYNKRGLNAETLRPQHCVEAGFACIVQDTRGRFASDGEWEFKMWHQEGPDSYDSVEWIARQPWCSGAVGMSGPSYCGVIQLVAAALKPPHLKAISPAMASNPEFERIETGGAFRLDQIVNWVAFMAFDWLQRRQKEGHEVTPEQVAMITKAATDPKSLLDHRPLREIPFFKLPGFPVTFEELLEDRLGEERDIADVAIPTLHVGGWYDIFSRATVGLFSRQAAASDTAHMLMGCWSHAATLPEIHGQVNFGWAASARDARVPDHHIAFFRRYLIGDKAAEVPRARYFLMQANEWRNAASWPPAGATEQTFFLTSGGRANTAAGDGRLLKGARPLRAAEDAYSYDPSDPTPVVGGHILSAYLVPGPLDQAGLHRRQDVLCYTSDPFGHDLDIVGPLAATLTVASSAVDTDFFVKLCDVDPEGVSLPFSEGVLRMRWRKGFDEPRLLTPDAPEQIVISMTDVAWRVKAGHRLRLQVQSANYPNLDANMNTGNEVGTDAKGVVARNRILHGPEHMSRLTLTALSS